MSLRTLLALCLLAAAWYFTGTDGEVVYACHNDTAHLSCEVGSQIRVEHVLYKMGVGTRCGEGKHHPEDGPGVTCSFPFSELVVEDLCSNKKSCSLPVTELVFGEYPCKERTRFLQVNYHCYQPPEADQSDV